MRWVHRLIGFVFVSLCAFPVITLAASVCGIPLETAYLLTAPGLLLASVLSAFFPRRYRIIGVILLLLWNAFAATLLYSENWLSIFAVLAMAISHLAALGASAGFNENPVTIREFGVGAALYGVSYALMFLHGDHSRLPMLGGVCVGYLVFSVLLLNLNAVNDAGHVARRVEARLPATLRGGNILLTLLFVGIAFALVNIETIKDLFMAAVTNILIFILWLASLGASEGSGDQGGGGMDLAGLLGGEEKRMPEWLEAALNVVLYLITAAVLLALVVLAGVAIYRGMRKLIAIIRKWLNMQGREAKGGMGYTDERTKLTRWQTAADDGGPGKNWLSRLMVRLPKWKDLNDRERVRYALQNIMYPEKRSQADRTRTARETVENLSILRRSEGDTAQFAEAYDRARYSEAEITPEDAENARRFVRGER